MVANTISKDQLRSRLNVYADSSIDIAAIEIDDLINEKLKRDTSMAQFRFVSKEDLPGKESMLYSHVTDDVIVIGYPEELYDDINLFPIIKSGVISSKWGTGFKNKPYFLIENLFRV